MAQNSQNNQVPPPTGGKGNSEGPPPIKIYSLTAKEIKTLVDAAVALQKRAYAPYSRYSVGAAVMTAGGRVFAGANIENASYGLSVCAERVAAFDAVVHGERTIGAIAIATRDGGTPCGACRQVLAEFAPRGSSMMILLVNGAGKVVREATLAELLPDSFKLSPSGSDGKKR